MELRSAILLAAQFALPPKGRQTSPISGIRLLPATGEHPPKVFASRQTAMVAIDVFVDVPNVVLDTDGAVAAYRAQPEASLQFDGSEVRIGQFAFKPWCLVEAYPGVPIISEAYEPTFQPLLRSSGIAVVLQAAGVSLSCPENGFISFRPGFVEATDGTRIARNVLDVRHTFQVHHTAFRSWPDEPCEYSPGTPDGAVFRWPGQVRWGELFDGSTRPYPDLEAAIVPCPAGASVIVSVAALRPIVRKAAGTAGLRAVRLKVDGGRLAVFGGASGALRYGEAVPALATGRAEVLIGGTMLLDALASATTPRVALELPEGPGPVLCRSGASEVWLWQVIA